MGDGEKRQPTEVLKQIIQVGVVVANLDERIQAMRRIYGIEPDVVKECRYPWMDYRGEATGAWARIASYRQFGVAIEFMEPMGEGASMQKDALRECGGHALHHIRFNDVDDNDEVTQMMAERGVEVYQEGGSIVNPNGKFTFYDTIAQLGFVTEVVTKPRE